MRKFPINAALFLGRMTRKWRGFPIAYILVAFILIPFVLLGISFIFQQGSKGMTVLGSLVVVFLGLGILYTVYYCRYKGGKEKCQLCLDKRERRRVMMNELPDDMEFLKAKVAALIEHTSLPEEAGKVEVVEVKKPSKGKQSSMKSKSMCIPEPGPEPDMEAEFDA